MSARVEPRIARRARPAPPTVEVNPHSVHVLGPQGSPLFDLVLDCGSAEPVTIIKLPTDLALILRSRLNAKLPGAQHD